MTMKTRPYIIFLAFLGIFDCNLGINVKERAHISIYYDSLSPKTPLLFDKLIVKSFLDEVWPYVDLQLFPNGNSTYVYNNKYEFTCPNGPNECRSNKIHTCAIIQGTNGSFSDHRISSDQFKFLQCLYLSMEHYRNITNEKIQNCATEYHLQGDEMLKCADGKEGDDAQAIVRSLTVSAQKKMHETGLPMIIVNGEVTTDIDKSHRSVCNFYKLYPCSRATIAVISFEILSIHSLFLLINLQPV